MKIVVLTKIVPVRVEFDKTSKTIIRSKEAMINKNDLIALDFAIQLKRKYRVEVIALTMSPLIYEQIFLKYLILVQIEPCLFLIEVLPMLMYSLQQRY